MGQWNDDLKTVFAMSESEGLVDVVSSALAISLWASWALLIDL